ncbi:hypothetical protein ACTFIU_002665 [Dictyostelium citrinum]
MKILSLLFILFNIICFIKSNEYYFQLSKIEMIKINNYSTQIYILINKNQSDKNNISKFMVSISNKFCKINPYSENEIKCYYSLINNNIDQNNDISIYKIKKNISILQYQTIIKKLKIDCDFQLVKNLSCINKIELEYIEINSYNNNDSSIGSEILNSSDQNDDDGNPSTGIIVIVIVISLIGLIIIGGLGTFLFLKYFIKRFQRNISKDIEINEKNLKSINASISEDQFV